MQSNLKTVTLRRSLLTNIIRFNTNIFRIKTLQTDLFYLEVTSLKRDYSNSVKQKNINVGEVFIDKSIGTPLKWNFKNDSFLNKNTNLNQDNSKLMTEPLNLRIGEKEWKDIWNKKFQKYKDIGRYIPKLSDRLFFSYLQERKLNLKSKYTFNDFLSSSKIINYNFQNANQKVEINSLYILLKSFFKTLKSLISFPILKNSPNKLKILLFYYVIPNKTMLKAFKSYQNYIRKDEKLFKDIILRTKLIKFLARFKMILFISKWKENNNKIKLPNLSKKANSISIPLVYKVKNGQLEKNNSTQEIDILTVTQSLNLNRNEKIKKSDIILTEIEQKIPIFNINIVQYNLSKLIPFHKNLISILLENNLKFINQSNPDHNLIINKILAKNLLSKVQTLSLSKDSNIDSLIEPLETLNISVNLKKENNFVRFSPMLDSIERINLYSYLSKLQLENNSILLSKNTSLFNIGKELILIYSELITLKEKIKNQDNLKMNYKKNIVYSLNFFNKLILFFTKLKEYKILLVNKQNVVMPINESHYEKNGKLNFEIEGLEELNLENLEKFYNSYSNFKINSKKKLLLEKKEGLSLYNYLKLPTIKEVVSLIKEQQKEFNEEPLIMNYSNPYAYKNANLLIISALHALYRAMLIEYLNYSKESNISLLLKWNSFEKDKKTDSAFKNLKFNDNIKKIREGITSQIRTHSDNESQDTFLNKIKSNNGSSLVTLNKIKFKYLISFLEKMFNKSIELELIRLKYPAHNSNILAQVLGLSSKRLKFFMIMRKLLYSVNIKHAGVLRPSFNIIPSYLLGIKIRLGGRLTTEKLIPRRTVKTYQMGSIARDKINFKDQSRLTLKNKRGAYSLTVITSHIFNTSKKIKY